MADTSKPWEHAKSSGSEADPLAARFVSSLDYDKRLYKHDIAGSVAHARMLEHVGLITADDLQQIEQGLGEIEQEIDAQGDAWPGWRVDLEDVHMCVEAALIEKAGDAGRRLHTGRSRNDQVATDLVMWIGEAQQSIIERVNACTDALVGLAGRYGTLVMPSYTHLQRAQPVVAGGEILAWANALSRAAIRMEYHVAGLEIPLGSGAIAGSSLNLERLHAAQTLRPTDDSDDGFVFNLDTGEPVDKEEFEQELLEGSITRSSIDATASRDAAVDFVYALSMTAMTLSRWAEQWIIYASTEFGFITLHDNYTTGSSMMPQKQNPDMLELIRGKAGGVYGSLVALLTMLKGLPIGYNRDLQEDKRHVFYAYDSVCDCLDMAANIVRTTTFNEDKIAATLHRGYLDATSLAEYLVTKGVPFRTSHQVVGRLVKLCEDEQLFELRKLSLEQMRGVVEELAPHLHAGLRESGKEVVGEDVYDWLGAENVVKRYQTAGNAGLSGFEEQLKAWKERLGSE